MMHLVYRTIKWTPVQEPVGPVKPEVNDHRASNDMNDSHSQVKRLLIGVHRGSSSEQSRTMEMPRGQRDKPAEEEGIQGAD